MSTKGLRKVAYEDNEDDYEDDDYEQDGGGELSAEDQAQMNAATLETQQILGPQADKVTKQQIQEALWYYYYDVDKSVAYIINKFIDPAPKVTKTKKEAKKADTEEGQARCLMTEASELRAGHSFADFFNDMPWLRIPKERETTFIAPRLHRVGLLGGAPKMSKLKQLAEQRRKKAEEQSLETSMKVVETGTSQITLGSPTRESKETAPLPPEKRRKLSRDMKAVPSMQLDGTLDDLPMAGLPGVRGTDEVSVPERDEFRELPAKTLLAKPSAFASALIGSPSDRRRKLPTIASYEPPYMAVKADVADAFSGPSPDDVVLKAQEKGSKKTGPKAAPKDGPATPAADRVAGEVKNLKIDDTPKASSKHLDVLKEYENSKSKRSATFVVVGHVDAGKSTLMGRLLLDLRKVDERTIAKYRKEAEAIGKSSFALAWVLDQRSEERERGVTIDISRNKFETETTAFTILDAPGHQDFIPNMIAGASQADFAVLVIDASTGAFESGLKGQTKEHSLLIRSMGVSRVIVAVNKLDTVDWSKARFDDICQQVTGFLTATGFQLKNVSFVPVSGLNGDNLAHRSADPKASWYGDGPTLVEELERSEPLARALTKPLRVGVSEVYRTAKSAVTVAGRVDAGSLQVGDAVLVQPSGESAAVKALDVDGLPADWAVAGQNAVLYLSGIDAVHVRPGDIACDPANPVPARDEFRLKVLAFDVLMPDKVDVHRGRLQAEGHVVELAALLDKQTGAVVKRRPRTVKPGQVARVVVRLKNKMPLEQGQRVVLRSGGQTVAAGLLE